MANKNNYIKNSNILTVELLSDNEHGSPEYNCQYRAEEDNYFSCQQGKKEHQCHV